ncbi:hypothetical protein Peur_039656 [Populus x canadensis]
MSVFIMERDLSVPLSYSCPTHAGKFYRARVFWSGSSLRTEATGYGLVFFVQRKLAGMNKEIKGLRCAVSGSGKITMHVLEKLIGYGALPITVSDSKGYLVDEDGFDYMKICFLRDIKAQQRSLRDYSKTYARSKYYDEAKPWSERGDVAFPCGYQNEIDQSDAINLVNSGYRILVQGSATIQKIVEVQERRSQKSLKLE